ncbi:MAG: hypothetical protein R3E39_17945 [Anaerolineae bacterium]
MAGDQRNYPDILGYVTGGARHNASVVQVALAVRPRVVRAGRPFEAILLIQNAADTDVDITATLQLPAEDAKKKPNRFIVKTDKLVIGLRPAETGYVTLPITCLPDTAISDSYKIAMSLDIKPLGKARRVRATEGGGEVALEYLSDDTINRLNELKKLSFSTTRRGLMGATLEAPFNVLSADIGRLSDLKPGWESLWRLGDYRDDRLLLNQYREVLETKVLSQIRRITLHGPLVQTTLERFQRAGFDILEVEAHYIAKLMVHMLEMAVPLEDTYDYLGDDFYNVTLTLKKDAPSEDPLQLPAWCKGMLKTIETNATAADQPAKIITTLLYDELLRDAILHGFHMVAKATGEHLGSQQEQAEYCEQLISKLQNGSPRLTFSDAYMPLVIGGAIIYDRAVLKSEKVGEKLGELSEVIKSRYAEVDEDNEVVCRMADQTVDRSLQKFGYRA